jgi:hypothetical protein
MLRIRIRLNPRPWPANPDPHPGPPDPDPEPRPDPIFLASNICVIPLNFYFRAVQLAVDYILIHNSFRKALKCRSVTSVISCLGQFFLLQDPDRHWNVADPQHWYRYDLKRIVSQDEYFVGS